jgi:hypothetical protein
VKGWAGEKVGGPWALQWATLDNILRKRRGRGWWWWVCVCDKNPHVV